MSTEKYQGIVLMYSKKEKQGVLENTGELAVQLVWFKQTQASTSVAVAASKDSCRNIEEEEEAATSCCGRASQGRSNRWEWHTLFTPASKSNNPSI